MKARALITRVRSLTWNHGRRAIFSVIRQHHAVGDDVVDVGSAHRRGIPNVAYLRRGRAQREDAGAGVGGVTGQINGDIDTQLARQDRNLTVAHQAHVVKMIAAGSDATTLGVVRRGAVRESMDLEAVPVVRFE